jgi:hypothetical protein
MVNLIQGYDQEVQLHLHTEWLNWISPSPLPGRTGLNIKDFSLDEQTSLLALARENLCAAGVDKVTAFRAGNYGANFDTLRALNRNGIPFDTSHNAAYLNTQCDMRTENPLRQPQLIEGVYEFPISVFSDLPGHVRHLQLCACSSQEIEHVLREAWRQGWHSVILVSHSFELVKRRPRATRAAGLSKPDPIVIGRFERLCKFLANHSDWFTTAGFGDVNLEPILPSHKAPVRSNVLRTSRRVLEQLIRRVHN